MSEVEVNQEHSVIYDPHSVVSVTTIHICSRPTSAVASSLAQ